MRARDAALDLAVNEVAANLGDALVPIQSQAVHVPQDRQLDRLSP